MVFIGSLLLRDGETDGLLGDRDGWNGNTYGAWQEMNPWKWA